MRKLPSKANSNEHPEWLAHFVPLGSEHRKRCSGTPVHQHPTCGVWRAAFRDREAGLFLLCPRVNLALPFWPKRQNCPGIQLWMEIASAWSTFSLVSENRKSPRKSYISSLSAIFALFWTVLAVEAFGYAWGAFWDLLSRVRGIWQNELRGQLSLKTPGLRGVCGDAMETQHFWWLFSQSHICLILNGSSSAGIWVRLRSVLRPAQWSTQKDLKQRCVLRSRSQARKY